MPTEPRRRLYVAEPAPNRDHDSKIHVAAVSRVLSLAGVNRSTMGAADAERPQSAVSQGVVSTNTV
eukprot:709771-Lingulodinium_polyedra.AAC.1